MSFRFVCPSNPPKQPTQLPLQSSEEEKHSCVWALKSTRLGSSSKQRVVLEERWCASSVSRRQRWRQPTVVPTLHILFFTTATLTCSSASSRHQPHVTDLCGSETKEASRPSAFLLKSLNYTTVHSFHKSCEYTGTRIFRKQRLK